MENLIFDPYDFMVLKKAHLDYPLYVNHSIELLEMEQFILSDTPKKSISLKCLPEVPEGLFLKYEPFRHKGYVSIKVHYFKINYVSGVLIKNVFEMLEFIYQFCKMNAKLGKKDIGTLTDKKYDVDILKYVVSKQLQQFKKTI